MKENQTEQGSDQDRGKKWIKHYSSSDKILLVGEGDFSFAACLATAFGSAANMVATSLDSKARLMQKYSRVTTNLNVLEQLGCTILHEVDVHTMTQHPLLRNKIFDRIIFNFPHAGFLFREHDASQIKLHKKLVKGFFRGAFGMLTSNGETHVTHKTAYPFDRWNVENLAQNAGLCLVEKVRFTTSDYPGYVNKRGDGEKCDETFPVGECSTFKFAKPCLKAN